MILYAIKFWDIVTETWKYHYCRNLKDVSLFASYLKEITSDYQVFSLSWKIEWDWTFDKEEEE